MLCLQNLDAFRAFLSGPASLLLLGGGRSRIAHSLLPVVASVVSGNAEAHLVPVSEKPCSALSPLNPHAAPSLVRSVLLCHNSEVVCRGGREILKTKYLQHQKLLGSPDLCDVIYVGEGGGLSRGNQQCTTSISFVL